VGKILLIAADWKFRALVRAQLLEEGFEVKTFPSVKIALAYLLRSGEQPRLTIVDLQGDEHDLQVLSDLKRLTEGAPLILCGGALSRPILNKVAPSQEERWPARVLLRPFRVRDLVREVRRMGAWAEGSAVAE
jgi:DNA-binding NtrC family response regulator